MLPRAIWPARISLERRSGREPSPAVTLSADEDLITPSRSTFAEATGMESSQIDMTTCITSNQKRKRQSSRQDGISMQYYVSKESGKK